MKSISKTLANQLLTLAWRPLPVRPDRLFFLLGHDRSGSTWLGSTIGYAENLIYLHEPMNEKTSLRGNWKLYNQLLAPGEESPAHRRIYDPAVRGLGTRDLNLKELRTRAFGSPAVVIKETGGMLLGEWFQNRYGGKVALIFRHPAPLVVSNLKMGKPNALKWLEALTGQEKIMALAGVAPGVESVDRNDVVSIFTASYCIRYLVTLDQLERNPEWIRLHYEDFCMDPVRRFQQLYGELGLPFTDRVRERIMSDSTTDRSESFFGTRRKTSEMLAKWHGQVDPDMERAIRSTMEAFSFPLYNRREDWER